MHLTRRLETAAKSVSLISSSLDSQDDDVCGFVSQLVHCFVATGETTRVARGLERVRILIVLLSSANSGILKEIYILHFMFTYHFDVPVCRN